jgi:hypothetical protein
MKEPVKGFRTRTQECLDVAESLAAITRSREATVAEERQAPSEEPACGSVDKEARVVVAAGVVLNPLGGAEASVILGSAVIERQLWQTAQRSMY